MDSAAFVSKVTKSQVMTLSEAGLSELDLENEIANDTSILGLGKVIVLDRQRNQAGAGRLDLLLQDLDGESRFEVELKLGSLDESHLVRAIEYWDIERRRYPAYEHCAVIVAEDVTSRFLNVIQLFSGSIPIVALQVNCIKAADLRALSFIKLIDSRTLRRDDQADKQPVTRESWVSYAGRDIVKIADECLGIINSVARRERSLTYRQQFIGLADAGTPNNFVSFNPMKSRMRVWARLPAVESWGQRLLASNVGSKPEGDQLRIDVNPQTFAENKELIAEILKEAVKTDEAR
jgi:hypothetical protein